MSIERLEEEDTPTFGIQIVLLPSQALIAVTADVPVRQRRPIALSELLPSFFRNGTRFFLYFGKLQCTADLSRPNVDFSVF